MQPQMFLALPKSAKKKKAQNKLQQQKTKHCSATKKRKSENELHEAKTMFGLRKKIER